MLFDDKFGILPENDIFIYQKCINPCMKQRQIQIMHSPTLNTVLMVEETLKKSKETMKTSQLKARLPRKVMHGTLLQILDYLQASGKIFIGTKGVAWIYRPQKELEHMKLGGLEA